MIRNIKFWLECSRWYMLPMTFFSWLVVFVFGLNNNGNFINGIIALIGVCFAHLAANLMDDYFDYRKLTKNTDENNQITLPNTQRGKCRYLLNNLVSLTDVLKVSALYCAIAAFAGIYLYFSTGAGILLFMSAGALIVILYSFLSNIRLSEFAVALAYGPLLFGGTFYAMSGHFSAESIILCIPTMIFTVNMLYTDTFLDRNLDINEGKKTIANLFKTGECALNFQKRLLIAGYLSVFVIGIFDIADWEIFLTYLTIPLALDLIQSLELYNDNPSSAPERKFFHFPFEAWDDIKENRSTPFMFRMYQARNLMMYFSLLLAVCIYFG